MNAEYSFYHAVQSVAAVMAGVLGILYFCILVPSKTRFHDWIEAKTRKFGGPREFITRLLFFTFGLAALGNLLSIPFDERSSFRVFTLFVAIVILLATGLKPASSKANND